MEWQSLRWRLNLSLLAVITFVVAACGRRGTVAKKSADADQTVSRRGENRRSEARGRAGARPAPSPGNLRTTLVEKRIAAIVAHVPSSLATFEKHVGKVNRLYQGSRSGSLEFSSLRRRNFSVWITELSMEFVFDHHHRDPFKERNPRIGSYTLMFRAGLRFAQDRLRKKFGVPRPVRRGSARGFRFDTYLSNHPALSESFYVFPGTADGFELSWYGQVPDFARPKRTAAETRPLTAKLVRLLSGPFTRQRIETILGKLKYDKRGGDDVLRAGTWTVEYTPARAARPGRVVIYFAPALPAGPIYQALGLRSPMIITTNVHMTSRVAVERKTRQFPKRNGYRIGLNIKKDGLKLFNRKAGRPEWRTQNPLIDHIEIDRAD